MFLPLYGMILSILCNVQLFELLQEVLISIFFMLRTLDNLLMNGLLSIVIQAYPVMLCRLRNNT